MKRLGSMIVLGLAVLGTAFGGCSSDDSSSGSGGQSGKSGGAGTSGSSAGGSAGAAAGGAAGEGGGTLEGGGGSSGSGNTALGAACSSESDCGSGLTCLTTGSTQILGGGPPKGLCTTDCTSDLEGDGGVNTCGALKTGALCVNVGTAEVPKGFCMEGCSIGPPAVAGQFDPNKCHGRSEVACRPIFDLSGKSTGKGFCLPNCNDDSDCGEGLSCNHRIGSCQDTVPDGLTVGSTCPDPELDAGANPCRGNCNALLHSFGGDPFAFVCSESCTLGALPACGWAGPGTGKADAYCLFVFDSKSDTGDLGACGQLCDCNDDCRSDALVCAPLPNQIATYTGRKGYCGDPSTGDGGTIPGIACSGK